MKLLFHCCCGPCALSCVESLLHESITPDLFWYNPNIHPYTEYASRRDALKQLAAAGNSEVDIIDEYGLRAFIRGVYPDMENGPQSAGAERCVYCYRLRLEKAAARAAEKGFDAFSTSLLASPYQKHETIRMLGQDAADRYRVTFLYRDFRPGFREGQKKARGMGLYTQKYCGCLFSEEERYCPAAAEGSYSRNGGGGRYAQTNAG